jgi:hypothetical protein
VSDEQRRARSPRSSSQPSTRSASNGLPEGSFATGPDGVSARALNRIGIIETTFEPFTPDAAKPFDGRLLLASPYGPINPLADISGSEAAHDPDGHGVESNPYGVLVYREGWLATLSFNIISGSVRRLASTRRDAWHDRASGAS